MKNNKIVGMVLIISLVGIVFGFLGEKSDFAFPNKDCYLKLKERLKLDNRYDWLPFEVRFNKVGVSDDVWLTPKSEKRRLGHPTQKPEKLFRRMIKASSNEGDVVLDIFMGSGTTAFACKSLKRKFIGFEIDKKYCDIINKRLQQEVLDFSSPTKTSTEDKT